MAPQVGLEPTTLRLTAGCSAIELLRSDEGTLGARFTWSIKIITDATTIGNRTALVAAAIYTRGPSLLSFNNETALRSRSIPALQDCGRSLCRLSSPASQHMVAASGAQIPRGVSARGGRALPSPANLPFGSSSTTRVRCLCWEVPVCSSSASCF